MIAVSVIAELHISPDDFKIGRILSVSGSGSIELERLVPVGNDTIPLFWYHDSPPEFFLESLQQHPIVNDAVAVDEYEDRTLFRLDWDVSHDPLFRNIMATDGEVLHGRATQEFWELEIRFSGHAGLADFRDRCELASISLEVRSVSSPMSVEDRPWYGLTERQRKALSLAVERGYYDIPRQCSTKDLARELGISDQAVTERLRRAIATLVDHTLHTPD